MCRGLPKDYVLLFLEGITTNSLDPWIHIFVMIFFQCSTQNKLISSGSSYSKVFLDIYVVKFECDGP